MKRLAGKIILFFLSTAFAPALSAQSEIDSLKQLLRQANETNRQLELYSRIGERFYRVSPDSTLYYTEKGIELADRTDTAKRDSSFYNHQAILLNNAAFINQRKGKLYEAILLYERSIEANKHLADTNSIGGVYMNLGTLYRDIREYDLALNYLGKAKKVLHSTDYTAAGNCLITIGTINMAKGQDEMALNNFYSALSLFQKAKDEVGSGRAFDQIGEVHYKRRDYDQALSFYGQSLNNYQTGKDDKGLSEVHFHIARLLNRTGKTKEAKVHAEQALTYAKELGYPKSLQDAASILYELYRDEGNYKLALEMHELFKTMSDTIRAEDAIKIAVQERLKSDYENKAALLKSEQDKQNELSSEALKRQELISYASVGGGILLLALLLLALRSYRVKRKANIKISAQKELIEEKNKEILDSINYANRIQKTLLAQTDLLNESLPEYFVLFRPKDIVSGDFYWATKTIHHANPDGSNSENLYLAICDSTGHGVPGAFMSLLNISFLNEAISEKKIEKPNGILNHVRERLIENISKDGAQDGMDGILLYFDSKYPGEFFYSAANNVPLIIRNKSAVLLSADKMPVGKSPNDQKAFTLYNEKIQEGDLLIAYTDGYADQFGGPKSKKFKYRQLDELIALHSDKPLAELRQILEEHFDSWKGELEQVDDVLIVGIRF